MRWIIFLQKNFYKILFFLFLIIGIISRIWKLGIVPGDLNADEAFSAYEAYSLLHYGMDSAGYAYSILPSIAGGLGFSFRERNPVLDSKRILL